MVKHMRTMNMHECNQLIKTHEMRVRKSPKKKKLNKPFLFIPLLIKSLSVLSAECVQNCANPVNVTTGKKESQRHEFYVRVAITISHE